MSNPNFLFNLVNFSFNYSLACLLENSSLVVELLCPPWGLCSNSEITASVGQLSTKLDPIIPEA